MIDPERQIRFLYPPIFLVASLLLGVRLDSDITIKQFAHKVLSQPVTDRLKTSEWGSVAATVAVAGGLVALLGAGYLISCVSVAALRASTNRRIADRARRLLGDRWWTAASYEAVALEVEDKERLRRRLRLPQPEESREPPDDLFLSAALDHEVLSKPLHDWIGRRWSFFYLAVNSATALGLALVAGPFLGIAEWRWTALSFLTITMLIYLAVGGWHDTMGMLKFEAARERGSSKRRDRQPLAERPTS